VRGIEQRSAGGLVHTAGLHAHQTVLHHVRNAHAVARGDFVAGFQQLHRVHLLAVDGHRNALLKVNGHIFRLVRRVFRIFADQRQIARRLVGRIFQIASLVREMPDVAIHRIRTILLHRDGDAARVGILDFLFAGLDIPLAPRRDDRHVRRKRLDGKLKTHLIVALAGAAVADGVAAFLLGDFNQTLGNQRTGEGRAQQILALIDGVSLERRPDEVLDKLLAQIFNIKLLRTGLLGLLVQRRKLFALPHISRAANHGAAVVLLEPRDDDGRIQAAGIRQQHTLVSLLIRHDDSLHISARRFRRWSCLLMVWIIARRS